MKSILSVILLGAGLLGLSRSGLAQDAEVVLQEVAPTQSQATSTPESENAESVAFQAHLLTRLLGVPVTVDGAIPMGWRADNPLQLLNPLAPMDYGDGYENVSVDPGNRRATGFKLFSLGF